MADTDTLAQLAEEVGLALAPLDAALQSPAAFTAFMAQLGWDMFNDPGPDRSHRRCSQRARHDPGRW